jgi:DNA-binding GntR family transcriptional regulator
VVIHVNLLSGLPPDKTVLPAEFFDTTSFYSVITLQTQECLLGQQCAFFSRSTTKFARTYRFMPDMPKETAATAKRRRPVARTARVAETAFRKLREAILSGNLGEGEVVRESRLARRWGIGRTPMREAVRRAAECGYFVLRPNCAPIVRKLNAEDIRHIYSLRELLECLALKGAWGNITRTALKRLEKMVAQAELASDSIRRLQIQLNLDREMHQLWIDNCGNPWLVSILERLLIYRPNLVRFFVHRSSFTEEAFSEHKALIEAMKTGTLQRATGLLARHIRRSGLVLVVLMAKTSRSK